MFGIDNWSRLLKGSTHCPAILSRCSFIFDFIFVLINDDDDDDDDDYVNCSALNLKAHGSVELVLRNTDACCESGHCIIYCTD